MEMKTEMTMSSYKGCGDCQSNERCRKQELTWLESLGILLVFSWFSWYSLGILLALELAALACLASGTSRTVRQE